VRRQGHNERCRDCKQAVHKMLGALFGSVKANWDLDFPSSLETFRTTTLAVTLESIHEALERHRGFKGFVRSAKLPKVDYFIPSRNLIIEFDESQHFTKPRDIALSLYPRGEKYGFSVEKWRTLCTKLDKRDNDPPYRDEQRAWYDTLRDFAPKFLGAGQTVRIYSRDLIWCSLNPDNQSDLLTFERTIMSTGDDQ
jgi:hypothetical protein